MSPNLQGIQSAHRHTLTPLGSGTKEGSWGQQVGYHLL